MRADAIMVCNHGEWRLCQVVPDECGRDTPTFETTPAVNAQWERGPAECLTAVVAVQWTHLQYFYRFAHLVSSPGRKGGFSCSLYPNS